jgi:hypothetical protein
MAERAFGREHVQKQIHLRQRKRGVPTGTSLVDACGEVTAPRVEAVLREGLALLMNHARAASRSGAPEKVGEATAAIEGASTAPPAASRST